jgi:hypothetical protein
MPLRRSHLAGLAAVVLLSTGCNGGASVRPDEALNDPVFDGIKRYVQSESTSDYSWAINDVKKKNGLAFRRLSGKVDKMTNAEYQHVGKKLLDYCENNGGVIKTNRGSRAEYDDYNTYHRTYCSDAATDIPKYMYYFAYRNDRKRVGLFVYRPVDFNAPGLDDDFLMAYGYSPDPGGKRAKAEALEREKIREENLEKRRLRKERRRAEEAARSELISSALKGKKMIGVQVCDPENKMGYVERIEDDMMQIRIIGQAVNKNNGFLIAETGNFQFRRENRIVWDEVDKWATCKFDD